MQGVARNFFTLAIVYALCGMVLGLHMSITQDHTPDADPCSRHGGRAG